MKIDLISKLQHLLQVMAFCLGVATLQVIFMPERPWAPPVAYSLTAELREVWEKTVDNLEEAGDLIEDAVDSVGDFGLRIEAAGFIFQVGAWIPRILRELWDKRTSSQILSR